MEMKHSGRLVPGSNLSGILLWHITKFCNYLFLEFCINVHRCKRPENKTVLLMLTILTMLQYLIYLEGT